jgi:hypothetical protein
VLAAYRPALGLITAVAAIGMIVALTGLRRPQASRRRSAAAPELAAAPETAVTPAPLALAQAGSRRPVGRDDDDQ